MSSPPTPTIAVIPDLKDAAPEETAPSPGTRIPPDDPEDTIDLAVPPTPSPEETTEDLTVATLSSPWAYDEVQPFCADCGCPFTPFNRRHHCRLCGKIFCNDCTRLKALIPPSSIVLSPAAGKKARRNSSVTISFQPDEDPDRMLTTYGGENNEVIYGKGLEERFLLARQPLRVCRPCHQELQPIQEELRNSNSNAMRYNAIDPTDPRRLFNSPLAFTLGHEVRKAAYTLNNLLPLPKRMGAVVSSSSTEPAFPSPNENCKDACAGVSPSLGDLDGVRIPARLLEQAKGIAVLTVIKGGFGLAGAEFGTGLVVARLGVGMNEGPSNHGMWSAPSAIGTAGLSWGALVGAQVSDHVFLLMTNAAVEMMFSHNGSLQLGADIGVALGPLGRALEADFGASPGNMAPIYTYSLSKGLYAGVSLDGKVIVTRHNINEKFYGRKVSGMEFLSGTIPTPPAAQPLYDALTRCHVYTTGSRPTRPSMAAGATTESYEYGEIMPPADNDQHSYAGMSDVTTPSDFGGRA